MGAECALICSSGEGNVGCFGNLLDNFNSVQEFNAPLSRPLMYVQVRTKHLTILLALHNHNFGITLFMYLAYFMQRELMANNLGTLGLSER